LTLDADDNFGVRQRRILEADETGSAVARGEQSNNQWKDAAAGGAASSSA
jgi:hypothetical protein